MAFQLWSWIFIFQTLFVRPGYAHVSHNFEVLAGRAMERVFIRGLTKAEKARNTYIGLAIAGSVVLVAGLIGLLILYLRQKEKVSEPESGVVPKPHWWMVDAKNEKTDWWRLGPRVPDAETTADGLSRIERLREVLQIPRKGGKSQSILPTHRPSAPSPTESLDLPMQTNPNIRPNYPESLERGYRAPIYPIQSPPRIPTVTTTMYDGTRPLKRSPSIPPQAIVTQGQRATLSRSTARSGAPRSPASRRWLSRNSFRHPFLPLKDSDAPLTISAPTPANIDPSNPKLTYAVTMSKPRTAPSPPRNLTITDQPSTLPAKAGLRKPIIPAPLQLTPRVGLPGSPRPLGLPGSPRPPRLTPAI